MAVLLLLLLLPLPLPLLPVSHLLSKQSVCHSQRQTRSCH
jgi:hypothetical protein